MIMIHSTLFIMKLQENQKEMNIIRIIKIVKIRKTIIVFKIKKKSNDTKYKTL